MSGLELKNDLQEKRKKLESLLLDYTREDVCVAFSGGVDSSLLLVMACEAAKRNKTKVYALTMETVLHPKADLKIARTVLAQTEAIHKVLTLNELAVPELQNNPVNRCYLCKKELYSRMLEFAESKGIGTLLEGSNEDDLHVYRPGLRAVRELGVKSPLAETGITKEEVRTLARDHGISVADRPSTPCLATRLPYGAEIDLELLRRIDQAEEFLRSLSFTQVRVRVHDSVVRLEINETEIFHLLEKKELVVKKLKQLGFSYITLDLEGFRSGSMDVQIEKTGLK